MGEGVRGGRGCEGVEDARGDQVRGCVGSILFELGCRFSEGERQVGFTYQFTYQFTYSLFNGVRQCRRPPGSEIRNLKLDFSRFG